MPGKSYLMSDSRPPEKAGFNCFNEILLKIMKNDFYFILQACSKIQIFVLTLLVM